MGPDLLHLSPNFCNSQNQKNTQKIPKKIVNPPYAPARLNTNGGFVPGRAYTPTRSRGEFPTRLARLARIRYATLESIGKL